MLRDRRLILCFVALSMLLRSGWGQDKPSPHPRVLGFERFYYDQKADAVQGGLLLLGDLNCTSCHAADDSLAASIVKKQAPILDEVGSRAKAEYLAKFLANPQAVKPGTTMPNVFANLSEAEAKANAEALAHFLATTGKRADAVPSRQAAVRGDALYHSLGCVVCHGPRKEDSQPLPGLISLGVPSRKYTLAGLTKFLEDPLHVRPSGRMPNPNVTKQQAADLAAFLLGDTAGPSGLDYSYYEGDFNRIADFEKLTPKESGPAEKIDLSPMKRTDGFGLRFDGLMQVPKDGDYVFYVMSDDGSRLAIDGRIVVDNDGVHAPTEKSGKVELKAGQHAFVLEFFEQAGGEELRVQLEGPGLKRCDLNDVLAVPERKPTPDAPKPWVIDEQLAAKGKQIFLSAGCASCHQLSEPRASATGEKALVSTVKGKPLTVLKPDGGCLTEQSGRTPFYALNATQKKAIAAALTAIKKPLPQLAANDQVHHSLVRFNCYGCHSRNEIGGVQDNVNESFTTSMKEIGDEGRLPPHLTIVGAKLTEAWLKTVIENGEKVRPYMHANMPKFGAANVGQLVSLLVSADANKVPAVPKIDVADSDKKFKASGRFLVGSQGLGCIKCHTFAGRGTPGIQVMDLATMARRLRPEWYYHYMLSPPAFRPGTRMPTAWPGGQSVLPKVLSGSTEKQIRSTWAYLLDGEKAQIPIGMAEAKIELLPLFEPIIYRNFIEGAGPRGIAVGFPEKVNYAWDADHMRLALIWQGAFIDAAMHWVGRGPGFQKPLGEPVATLPAEAPLAILASNTTEWPATTDRSNKDPNYRFHGYELDKARLPTFRYDFKDVVHVEDFIQPKSEGEIFTLTRTLNFSADKPVSDLHFLVATGNKIEAAEKGWYVVNDNLRIHIDSADPPIVRESKGRKELLVPVKLKEKTKVGLEYEW
jgi:mono/diheme cytochrome c family protein